MEKPKPFKFVDHPWISFWTLIILVIVSIIFSAIVIFGILGLPQGNPYSQFSLSITGHLLMICIIAPFLLKLPNGKRAFVEYLSDIKLLQVQPLFRLLLITVSCYIILMFCQAMGAFVFRISEGGKITGEFIQSVFNISRELPPRSLSLLSSFPSVFEEIVFRGILLTYFLSKYSKLKAILFSSSGFAIIHIFNLASGRDPIWVTGQIVWAFILGIFYGYLFIKTSSLLPVMLFHYLSNVFVGTFNSYIQSNAPIEIQVLYGIIFTFGILPTGLMVLWIKFYTDRWSFKSTPVE